MKVTDRDGKVTVIQIERIHMISTFNGGTFIDLITGSYIKLNLSVEELFDQIQSHLEKIPTLDN